jgi:hypothetical protein
MVILADTNLRDYTNLKGYFIIIFGLLFLIFGIYKSFSSIESFYVIIFSLTMILDGVFNIKGYLNRTYYLTFFILIALYGLTLIYNILFIPFNNIFGYLFIVAFPFGLIYVTLAYLSRYKCLEMPLMPLNKK